MNYMIIYRTANGNREYWCNAGSRFEAKTQLYSAIRMGDVEGPCEFVVQMTEVQ